MSSRKRRMERNLETLIAKEQGISKKQARKKYVTRMKDMDFLN